MIALVILALTGAGLISLLTQTLASVHEMHAREAETSDAAAAIESVASYTRAQLIASTGTTRLPTVWLQVAQPEPSLFVIVVRDTLYDSELLRSAVYRPDSAQ